MRLSGKYPFKGILWEIYDHCSEVQEGGVQLFEGSYIRGRVIRVRYRGSTTCLTAASP